MSPADPPVPSNDAPTDPPAAPPASPPTAPPAPPAEPPSEAHGDSHGDSHSDSERMNKLEAMVGNVMDAVTGLTEAFTSGEPKESQPQKKPWTHWGTKK